MKSTDPKLPSVIMRRIMAHKDFHEVATQVSRNASGKIYLVGGKVYRTAIEVIHGYYCGANEADWDWLCVGEVVKPDRLFLTDGWNNSMNKYYNYKDNSLCLKKTFATPWHTHMASRPTETYQAKIDIIGIKDVVKGCPDYPREGKLQDYLDVVPLTVQSIALSTDSGQHYPALYGVKAIKAIERKIIEVNNSVGCLPNLDLPRYIKEKADSLNFTYTNGTTKIPCNCYAKDNIALWNYGCQNKLNHC